MRTMDIINNETKAKYLVPTARALDTRLETSFLASNLEPIDGGDGQYIDW